MMAVEAPIAMPGSYFPDHEDALARARPLTRPFFYVPPSPSASSVLSSSFQTISRTSSASTIQNRKRPRLDASDHAFRSPRRRQQCSNGGDQEVLSPAPLVNTDYKLAGGLDRPSAEWLGQAESSDYDYEQDHRVNRYNRQSASPADSCSAQTPRTENSPSRKRRLSSSPKNGWGKTVWDFTGGVAGMVFNFCLNTAFHGFHAGGGRGYNMQMDPSTVTAADMGYIGNTEDVFDAQYRPRGSTPLPGGFPEDDLIEDYMSRPQSHQYNETPTPTTNVGGGSSLKNNWVMVNELYTDMERSPARKRSRPSTANLYARCTPRQSLSARPRLQASKRSGASFASPRATGASVATGFRPQSSDGSDRQQKRSRSSIASPRRPEFEKSQSMAKSPDLIKFEKKVRRQDQKQDVSMRRMNQQMQEMMREAQQALAFNAEPYEDVGDEGYGEGTEISTNSSW